MEFDDMRWVQVFSEEFPGFIVITSFDPVTRLYRIKVRAPELDLETEQGFDLASPEAQAALEGGPLPIARRLAERLREKI